MSEAEELSVGSEGTSHTNGNRSSAPGVDYFSLLSDEIALLILARLPLLKYRDLRLVNRRFRSLIKFGELIRIRKKIGIIEPIGFLFCPEDCVTICYEPYTRPCWNINLQNSSDSEIWSYALESNRLFNGLMMITPRYTFAFADCGSVACIAGGQHQGSPTVLNSAEKYNRESKSWEPLLPNMIKQRNFCSGFYMDSKFYVVGGRNENGDLLTCGECYDFERNVWELIPNMIEYYSIGGLFISQPPDLMTVVNNELYYLEFPSRNLNVYLKNNNTWKKVGRMPASIERLVGWRVALKSVGNELLLIGRTSRNPSTSDTFLCFCTPSPELDDVEWHVHLVLN